MLYIFEVLKSTPYKNDLTFFVSIKFLLNILSVYNNYCFLAINLLTFAKIFYDTDSMYLFFIIFFGLIFFVKSMNKERLKLDKSCRNK